MEKPPNTITVRQIRNIFFNTLLASILGFSSVVIMLKINEIWNTRNKKRKIWVNNLANIIFQVILALRL